jgi:hypothetical protein
VRAALDVLPEGQLDAVDIILVEKLVAANGSVIGLPIFIEWTGAQPFKQPPPRFAEGRSGFV